MVHSGLIVTPDLEAVTVEVLSHHRDGLVLAQDLWDLMGPWVMDHRVLGDQEVLR